jgi:hypothetical protein
MKIARSLSIYNSNDVFQFRAKPEYRSAKTQFLRDATASKIHEMRNSGLIDPKIIRQEHEQLLKTNIGYVWAGDLAAILKIEEP